MPSYSYKCDACEEILTAYRTVDYRHDCPRCPCGGKTTLAIVPTMIAVDIPAYRSPINGRVINSRKQRHEDLKQSQSRPWEGLEQEKKEAARQEHYREQKLDAALTKSASEAFYQLPPSKREILSRS